MAQKNTNQQTTTTPQLKKVTVPNIMGKPKAEWASEGPTDLFAFYGLCRSYAEESNSYGVYIRFKGDFKARNMRTGQEYRSATAILPKVAEDFLANVMLRAQEYAGMAYVEFGIVVGMVQSDTPVGYEFTVRTLVEDKDTDPLAALEAKIMQELPSGEFE